MKRQKGPPLGVWRAEERARKPLARKERRDAHEKSPSKNPGSACCCCRPGPLNVRSINRGTVEFSPLSSQFDPGPLVRSIGPLPVGLGSSYTRSTAPRAVAAHPHVRDGPSPRFVEQKHMGRVPCRDPFMNWSTMCWWSPTQKRGGVGSKTRDLFESRCGSWAEGS